MKLAIALLLVALSAIAQTPTPAIPTVSAPYPSYFVSTGGGYTRNNGTPNVAEGWVSAAVGLGGGNYSITTVDMLANVSTIRTGFMKVFSRSGNFSLGGRVDAGVAAATPTIGSFSGGAIMLYDLKGFSGKLSGIYLVGELRITAATQSTPSVPNQITPGLFFGFGKSF